MVAGAGDSYAPRDQAGAFAHTPAFTSNGHRHTVSAGAPNDFLAGTATHVVDTLSGTTDAAPQERRLRCSLRQSTDTAE